MLTPYSVPEIRHRPRSVYHDVEEATDFLCCVLLSNVSADLKVIPDSALLWTPLNTGRLSPQKASKRLRRSTRAGPDNSMRILPCASHVSHVGALERFLDTGL